jgi:hypothetical protein
MVNEDLALRIFGVVRTSTSHCVCHNQPQTLDHFRDEISVKEFFISGLCQSGQDEVFNSDEWEEEEELAEV